MKRVTRRELIWLSTTGSLGLWLTACGLGRAENSADSLSSTTTESSAGMGANVVAPEATPPPVTDEVRITPNDRFYTVDIGRGVPNVDLADYRLTVTGDVDTELSLSFEELRDMSAGLHMRTMECISNPVGGNLIGNAVWEVVPMREIIERAGPGADAVEVITRAGDGFHTSVPLETVMDPLAYLAIGMNGELLPPEHGFPVRCLWPGRYGMKQPKWLFEIDVVAKPHTGYWEQQGWSNTAFIKVNSQIERPANGSRIAAGETVVISGRAFADRAGVATVEVSTDDGETWREAELVQAEEHPTLVWTLWQYEWDTAGAAGRHVILARATDGDGNRQEGVGSSLLGGTFPDGTSKMHAISVNVREA